MDQPTHSGTSAGSAHILLREVQTTQRRAPPGVEVEWLGSLLPGDLYVVEYVGGRVAHSRLALWPREEDVWIGLARDDDVNPEDLHCPRLDSRPRRADPPGSTRLPVNSSGVCLLGNVSET